MTDKPAHAEDYKKESVELICRTCLYVATKPGDLIEDMVVVGGLVPSLLIPGESLPKDADAHIGTMDLDIGLSLALLDTKRYEDFVVRLRRADFKPDENEAGNPAMQRWMIATDTDEKITVDFLIPPSLKGDIGGVLRHI